MTKKFPPVSSGALELAIHEWADWVNSLDMARRQLGWKAHFSEEEWSHWAEGLDQELVWNLALSSLDRLELPRLFAGYWIACLLSPYEVEEPGSYWRIRSPIWVISRMTMLLNTLLFQESAFDNKFYGANTYSSDSLIGHPGERLLPPSYVGVAVPDPPSFVTIHVPRFLIPGLATDPSPLVELLREVNTQYGKHPLSELLQRVGRPVGGDWARRMISEAKVHQLRLLYKYLLESEYAYELVESLSLQELKRVVRSSGEMAEDVLALGYDAEQLVAKKERTKIKWRVRKRVTGWFKGVGRWPLPRDETSWISMVPKPSDGTTLVT